MKVASAVFALVSLSLWSHPAAAQERDASEVETLSVETYTGGSIPRGTHVERRSNPMLVGVGAVMFAAGYIPWAIQGVVLAANPPAGGTAWDNNSAWDAVPVIGPIMSVVAYNNWQQQECPGFAAYVAADRMNLGLHTSYPNGSVLSASVPCVDLNAGMTNAQGTALPLNLATRTATPEDWLWAGFLSSLQVYGIATVIWGMFAHKVLVPDAHPGTSAARPASRALRWTLLPGVGASPLGVTFSAVNF